MNRNRIAALALSAGLAATGIFAVVAQAMEPYHIKNSASSTRWATLWKGTNTCSSSEATVLDPGEIAKSTLWTSFKVSYGGSWWVYVYDGSSGQLLATRKYVAGQCVRAYTTNRYFIFAPNSGSRTLEQLPFEPVHPAMAPAGAPADDPNIN